MSVRPHEHRMKIAEARNILGEVIARARFADEPTVLVNRGKEAAVIVSHDFYEQAVSDREAVEAIQRACLDMPDAELNRLGGRMVRAFQEMGLLSS